MIRPSEDIEASHYSAKSLNISVRNESFLPKKLNSHFQSNLKKLKLLSNVEPGIYHKFLLFSLPDLKSFSNYLSCYFYSTILRLAALQTNLVTSLTFPCRSTKYRAQSNYRRAIITQTFRLWLSTFQHFRKKQKVETRGLKNVKKFLLHFKTNFICL